MEKKSPATNLKQHSFSFVASPLAGSRKSRAALGAAGAGKHSTFIVLTFSFCPLYFLVYALSRRTLPFLFRAMMGDVEDGEDGEEFGKLGKRGKQRRQREQ